MNHATLLFRHMMQVLFALTFRLATAKEVCKKFALFVEFSKEKILKEILFF